MCWVYLCVNRIFEILKHTKARLFSSIKCGWHWEVCSCLVACQLCLCPATFSTAYQHHALSSFSQEIRLSTYLLCIPSNTNFFLLKSCPRCWISCWLLNKHCSEVCCDEFFRCHKLTAKVNKWRGKFHLQLLWGITHYVKHRKHRNLWMNNKVRGD